MKTFKKIITNDDGSQQPEFSDLADLPEIVRAMVADDETARVFAAAMRMAIATGASQLQAMNDAWGKITATGVRTADGKYTISGTNLLQPGQEKAAANGTLAKLQGITSACNDLLGRVGKLEKRLAPPTVERTYRIVGKGDDNMYDALEKFDHVDVRSLAMALIADAQAHPIDLNQVGRNPTNGKK